MNRENAIDSLVLQHRVEQFLFLEARLADQSAYEDWLELFDSTITYWVPRGRADYDKSSRVSYINDNRARLETRVRQLRTGTRWAQDPPSGLCRVVSNVEIIDTKATCDDDAGLVEVASNVIIREAATQGFDERRTWAGRVRHHLRPLDTSFLIRSKTVEIVGSERSLPTLAFLL